MLALEIIGFIAGVLGVWLTLKKNIFCFPIGIINVCVSFFIFFEQKLYGDSMQQIVYFVLLAYGWLNWKRNNLSNENKIFISRLNLIGIAFCLTAILISTLLLGFLLKTYTDASFAWIDSFASSCAFVAQYLIARKKIETWPLWILVNIIYIVVYIQKDLFVYAFLFSIYGVLALWGWWAWNKDLNLQKENVADER